MRLYKHISIRITTPWSKTNYPVQINPFKPKFTIVIFIYHKPRIAVAILDL